MAYIDIYDSDGYRIGYVKDDVWCDIYGNIKGYIMGEYVTDSLQYGRILYGIHDNGDITDGTSRYIVYRINNGVITEKTSNRIIGELRYYNEGNNKSISDKDWYDNSYKSGYELGKKNPGCGIIVLVVWAIFAIIISVKSEYFTFFEVFLGFPIVFALIYFVAKLFG